LEDLSVVGKVITQWKEYNRKWEMTSSEWSDVLNTVMKNQVP
jgi:hypothetical protein